jgi:Peptidase family M28
MQQLFLAIAMTAISCGSFAQDGGAKIMVSEVRRVEELLSSDAMRGRKVFTPDIDKAADFIAKEFASTGLQLMPGLKSYRQEFSMVESKLTALTCTVDGANLDGTKVVVITSQPELKIDASSPFEIKSIHAGGNFFREAISYIRSEKNLIVIVDTSFAGNFSRLNSLKQSLFKSDHSIVFLLIAGDPQKISIEAKHKISEQHLSNVVGLLPGKSKKDEYVIFSAHYDHLGIGNAVAGDSIYNGANDDAAGTTAVITLASYFKELGTNERTLVFAAFTAEEEGGFGSQYFSRQLDPARIVAMFNIEMIGTESKWGKNSAYITGYEKSDLGSILQKNLEGSEFQFYPDPYVQQNLFYRSDNATLARLGVPAHTISTSKMDSEPNYHELSDEIGTLDLENMARIIQSIAISAKGIIAGNQTPSRVKVE